MSSCNSHKHISPSTRFVVNTPKPTRGGTRCTYINADTVVLTLEGNCRFLPLKLNLGRLKRHCNDMSTLMAALVKYADSDNTKDPESEEEKPGKGIKNAK